MKIVKAAAIIILVFYAFVAGADEYKDAVAGTRGLGAYWSFEEMIDPRLAPEKRERLEVDEQELRGLFFPGGSRLKISARVHDSRDKFFGRTEEVTTGEDGISGKAFGFDGKDSLVYLFRDPALEPGTGNFTFELWIRPADTDSAHFLVHRLSPFAKGNGGIYLCLNPKGVLIFSIVERQGRAASVISVEGAIVPGRWQHIVALRRGTTAAIYVNGKLVKEESVPVGLQVPPYGDTVIGGTPWDRRFSGLIDEVAYYNRALSSEEIVKHFRAAGP